jgi:hypothetical protein
MLLSWPGRCWRSGRFWRVAVILGGLAALALMPTAWLERSPSVCLYWNVFGVHCPGCGMTRAFSALLHADFARALSFNKLVVVVFPAVVGVLAFDLAAAASSRKRKPPS